VTREAPADRRGRCTIGGKRNGDQVTTDDSFVGDVDYVPTTTG
jgi:hypothetical protein